MSKSENLTGKVFTRWVVLEDIGGEKVLCRCSCGTERWVSRSNLKSGISKSCGCLHKEKVHSRLTKDLTGKRFGKLVVTGLAGRDEKNQKLLWNTVCDCGNTKIVRGEQLLKGETTSCGCLKRELIKQRCTKPMIGKTFGRLTVLSLAYNKDGHNYYECLCTCGNRVVVDGIMLRSGNTRSCGCYKKERTSKVSFKDLTGQRFGKLIVIKRVDDLIQKNGRRRVRFLCQCDCGGTIITTRDNLVSGATSSCGCIQSKGEYIISQILLENNINFEKQKTFSDLRGKSQCGILRFDFYIVGENYLIEYDGQHHFEAGGGWCNEEHVTETQKRDKLKDAYCKRKGIPLIRIPYTHASDICLEDLVVETTKFRVV